MMKIIRKTGVCLLSLLMILSLFLSGSPGKLQFKDHKVSAAQGSTTTGMSEVKSSFAISRINRPASEGLWKITAGGKTTFCLNSGKSMCSGDTVKYKKHNAVTFKNQGIVKALTYYQKKLSHSDKNFGLIQAYIWACGAGVSKKDTVYQAGKNFDQSYSSADAKKFCDKIKNTDPEGTVYYYSVTHCVKGKSHDAHQMLYRLAVGETTKPKRDKLSVSGQKSEPEELKVKIRKRDQQTSAVLSGAQFRFYCDGTSVGTAATGEDGIAAFSYTRNLKTETKTIKKKYITNWNELTKAQQTKETNNGYYSSKAKAKSAADAELKSLLERLVKEMKTKNYTWKAQEIKAPSGHQLNKNTVTKIETGTMTTIEFGDLYDNELSINLEITKKSTIEDFGTDASYVNAIYGVYAKKDILKSDNKTVLYPKDTKVTTIVTDSAGYGCAKGLPAGEYYLKEEDPPAGFEKNEAVTNVTLDKDSKVTVYDAPYTGKIRLHKTYDSDLKNEEKAVFEIYNSKEELVDTITTGEDGIAETKELPYGAYTIHQAEGTPGFEKIPDMIKNIDGTEKIYEIEANNPPEAARITLTKTISANDEQSGVNLKQPEEGAKFEIIQKSTKQVVQTLTTDQNGYAASKSLEPGIYTVHQIKGKENYAYTADFDVTLKDGDKSSHTYTLDNPWDGKKLMIQKTMEKNQKEEAEAAAEFTVINAGKAGDYNKADLSGEKERKSYIAALSKDAIVGTLTTDAKGCASILLSDLKEDQDFVVIQTKGQEGYDLAPVYDSRDHKAKEVDGMKVYEFTAKDTYSDSASIRIEKQKKITDTKTAAEEGAVFELLDINGDIVTTLTTGADGTAMVKGIALGTYTLHQTKGSNKHELMEDQTIVLTKKDKSQTVSYRYEDTEKPVDFILEKRSKETKKLLDGATYTIYDDSGKEIAVLQTGTYKDGAATCKLPYGHYTIRETNAPDGYNKNETEKEFTLDLESVDYDKDGNGTYLYQDTDEPVYGEITLKKTGDVLTGYDNGFTYENDQISGAVYGLYAREDIKKDDGSVVWKADTLIDQKTTTKDSIVKFTRKDTDGKETTKFYQGAYYVKEIKTPHGYCKNPEEYDVVIDWDTKPGDMNDIRETEEVPDEEEPEGNNTPYPSTGIYVLETGEALNEVIRDAKSVTFTWEEAPADTELTDVSQNQDESVMAWKDGEDYYISSRKAGQIIYMNAVSGRMFADCRDLTAVRFKNIDTSQTVDMSEMFYGCSNLKELDLSAFNMSKVEDVRKMFYGCGNLKTAYVQDQMVKAEDDYKDEKLTAITAKAKTDFMVGDTYHAEDFTFSGIYDDDGSQELADITDDDVSFSPETADYAGERKVTITFKDSGKYKGYDPIETTVNVIDPGQGEVSLDTAKEVHINVEANDFLQKYSIHLIKKDTKGNHLKGATFALKAGCEIVDHNGKTIFEKGDIITTAVSQDDQFGYIEFFGLPTDLYAKDGDGSKMYVVEETSPPDGYVKSDETLTFDGSVRNDTAENFIHDVAEEGNEDNDENTYIHDSKVIENEHTDYITVKKYWIDADNAAKKRPISLTITATNTKTHEVKTYVLNESNNWQMQTDIRQQDHDLYEFREQLTSPDYSQIPEEPNGQWNKETYVVSYTNRIKENHLVNINATKVWNDAENADGIRPDSVKIWVYQNGVKTNQSKILDDSNHWKTSFNGLKQTDDTGNAYQYEIREEETDVINGDSKTGYEITYDVSESNDSEGNTTINTDITNTHTPKTTQKSIEKHWDDQDDQDGIRPDSVKFHLMADGKVIDTVILSAKNGWKAKSKVLPKCENGNEIEYTWEEVKEGVVTGDDQIGYKVSYDEESDSGTTIATNTHTPGRGSITVTKELDPSNLNMDVGDATFTFTLTGTDVYGKKHTYKKEVEFQKDKVKEQLKNDPDGKIQLSVTFDDLYYGTYTCKESGMEQYFHLKSLTSESSNASVDSEGKSVTFKIGPEEANGSAKLDGEATFINQMNQGSILLKKKDSQGAALQGVTFVIEDSNGNRIATKQTDEKGEVKFENLLPDTYVITETKTTGGNSLLKEPIRVSFPMILTQTQVDQKSVDTKDAIHQGSKYYFYELTYEVENHSRMKLPTTGGWNSLKTYLPLLCGIGMVLVGLFTFWRKKKYIVKTDEKK